MVFLDKYIIHETDTYWGGNIWIMHKDGIAFAKLYWWTDEPNSVYLSDLSVNDECRKLGIGKELQEIREYIGRERGAVWSKLWVGKKTWMRKWYGRRGYNYWKKMEDDDGLDFIWLRKKL